MLTRNCRKRQQDEVERKLGIQTVKRVKYLGIWLTAKCSTIKEDNYDKLTQQIQKDLDIWAKLQLSLIDRIAIIKINILPKLLFLFQLIPIRLGKQFFEHLNRMIGKFIWWGKKAWIKCQYRLSIRGCRWLNSGEREQDNPWNCDANRDLFLAYSLYRPRQCPHRWEYSQFWTCIPMQLFIIPAHPHPATVLISLSCFTSWSSAESICGLLWCLLLVSPGILSVGVLKRQLAGLAPKHTYSLLSTATIRAPHLSVLPYSPPFSAPYLSRHPS